MNVPIVDPAVYLGDTLNKMPRPVPAFGMIVEGLRANLWNWMEVLGFDKDRCEPQAFQYAGEEITEKWPVILVGGTSNMTDMGAAIAGSYEVLVTVAYQPKITRRQFEDSFDIATVCMGILWTPPFRKCIDRSGPVPVSYWNKLVPSGFSLVPPDWQYSGWILHLRMEQTPGSNLWETNSPGGDDA